MKNLFTNLMKNTAKRTQNTGGGTSQSNSQSEHACKKGTSLAEGSWVESRVTLGERRGNHAVITRKSPGNHPLLEGIWKYVAMIFAVLVMSMANVGMAWGADITVTPYAPTNISSIPYGLYTMSHSSTAASSGSKISSGAITTGTNGDVITIHFATTKSDMYIKSITFNSLSNGTLSSSDGTISSNTFTASSSKNAVDIVLTSGASAKGTVKITNVVIDPGTNDVETITFTGFSSPNVTFSSSAGTSALTSITKTSGSNPSVSSNILTWPNSAVLTFSSSRKITYIALQRNDGKNDSFTSSPSGLTDFAWTGNSETVAITNSAGGGRPFAKAYVIIAPACTSISPSLSYTSTSLMVGDDSSSPTLTGNTGSGTVTWTSSDEDVATVNESTGVVTAVAAGTATITASIAANGGYCNGSATANFTITRDPVGEDHVLTWPITTVSGSSESNVDGGTTDIGTGTAKSTSSYITNQTDLTGVGVKRTTTGKNDNTGKIETPTSYDAAKYVSFTFDVEDGYQFTPTEVSIKTVAVSTAKDLKFEFSDANGSYSVTKANLSTNATAATNTLDFSECDVDFTGTVTVKIYVYGANDAYRLSTPLTITGTVAAAASSLSTTNPSSASYVKGASATALSVTASGGTTPYSYQWYSCDDAEKTNPSTVGTNSASYTPGTTSTGYYYCTVTDAASSSVSSSVATITVRNAYAPTASPAAGAVASGTAITLSSSDGGTIYYTTNGDTPDDESTAYDSEAKPTITTATTIKAVAKVNDYLGSVLTAAYTIKPTPGLAYGTSTVNKTNGDANFTNSLTNPNSVSVTYSSSDEDVATVDSDGEVTIKSYGSSTITASFAGNASYLAQEVSYTLNVAKRTYTVTYNAGTGTITGSHSDDTKTEDETLTLPGVTFTQSGYLQTGWAESDGGSKAYDLEDSYTDNEALDLYPVWSEVYAVEEGSISNGSITISPTSAIAGATVSLTASASLGYVFDSWTITKTSDESDVTASVSLSGQTTSASFTMPAYGVTVTAAFEEVTYTLSYDDGSATDGDVPESPAGSYAAGSEITVPDNTGSLVKGTDVFRGWTDGTTFYLAGQKFTISGNTTLTAVWDGGLSCETLAQVAVKSDYTMNDIVGSSVISGFDSKGQSQVGSTTEYANKLGSSGYVRISPKDGSSFAAGDKISIRIYNGKTSTKSINVALLQSDGSTKTELTAKSMDANTATTFEHTLVAAEISATGYVQVMRGETNGDGGWFISATIEHCVKTNFTVSFDMKGHGSAQDSYVGVPTGKKIVAPSAPTATGYTFGGWYTDSGCTSVWNWESSTVTKDTTLYAKWTANEYAINYYDEGGSAFSGSHADGYPTTHTYGTATTLKSASKDCYTFDGWYTSSSCTGDAVTSLGATDYTAAINLYAKWTVSMAVTAEPEDAPATVGKATEIAMTATGASTYQWQVCDDNEGTNATNITGSDTEYEDYDEATLSLTPASEGTYYLRCKITDACSNVKYSDVVTVTATEAYDIEKGTYTNGKITIDPTSAGAGSSISIEATPNATYMFKEWSIHKKGDANTTVSPSSSTSASTTFTMPAYDVTVNAVFKAKHKITTSVSGSGGTVTCANDSIGETMTTTVTATPGTGYTFGSWAVSGTGASLSSTTANPTTFTMGTANATVTATFSAKTYSVSLDQGIGSSGSENVTMTYNSSSHTSITAPTAPTGYTFAGWYTAAGGTGSMVMNASGVLQASVDGYTDGSANWTKDATCTLYAKYTANYPDGYLYITDVMATPETKAGYTITASATDADYDADLDGSFSHSGLQHWAKASAKNTGVYTLTFSDALTASATAAGVAVDVWWGSDNGDNNAGTKVYINGTADSDEIGYQKTDSKTRQQLLEGLKNIQAVGTTSVSSLQLKCTDNAGSTWFRVGIKDIPGYLLTYDDGEGSGAPSASYQPNATITLSTTEPTYAGHGFVGWQVDGSGTVYAAGDDFDMPDEATTLVAKWCTSISPSLSYSKTTLWVEDDNTATATLTGYYGTPTISYVSSDPTVVRVDNASTGAITALKRGTATITATIGATTVSTTDYCGNTVTCDITVKEMSCEHIEIASAILTNSTTATPVGGTALIKGLYGTGPYKLNDKPSHFGIKLNSNFQVGDSIIFKLKVGDWWSGASAASLPVVVFAGEDLEKEIYRTTSLTANTDNTYVRFAVTQEMIDDYSLTDEVIIYRTKTNDASCTECCTQNHQLYWVKVKRNACADVYYFNDESTSGEWSDEENWLGPAGQGGGLPTIDDRVVINKPMTVNIPHATAAEVILDQNGNTGKLTIQANMGLEVAGTVQVYNGSSYGPTTPADLVLESSADGNASLIFNNNNECQATVQMYSIASISGDWNWQFMGIPFTTTSALYSYYDSYLYEWNAGGYWDAVANGGTMTAFTGYCITQDAPAMYVMGGTLNPNDDVEITIPASKERVMANSWSAPISVCNFTETTLPLDNQTIYLFNTGHNESGATAGTAAGTYVAMPISSAIYTGNYLIAPMEGFYVDNTSGSEATITLKYDELVRPSGSHTDIVAGPMHAPRRVAATEEPAVMKLKATGSRYSERVVILEREDFSAGFDNGWDGKNLNEPGVAPILYALREDGTKDAVSAIPTYEGTVVGFRNGEDNFYTFSFEYDGEENWYLNDLKEQKSTLIHAAETYEFVAEPGDTEARFVISATPIHKIATGNESTGAEAAKVRKLIIDDKVYIIRGGRIYSVDGQMIK